MTLYTEICAYLRTNMRIKNSERDKLRDAERKMAGIIHFDRRSGCSEDRVEQNAWIFAKYYADA